MPIGIFHIVVAVTTNVQPTRHVFKVFAGRRVVITPIFTYLTILLTAIRAVTNAQPIKSAIMEDA